MSDIQIFKIFNHRQVVINFYEEDELVDRNGFFFDTISVEPDQLIFMKEDVPYYSLPVIGKRFTPSNRFKNHYILAEENPSTRVEVYFP